jgi:hypothetical protein
MISHYAQAYNQTNPIMINIGIACRERRCDSKNFGTRITWFDVTIGKIWRFEVAETKLEFWKGSRGIFVNTESWKDVCEKIYGCNCNLAEDQGSRCKIPTKF